MYSVCIMTLGQMSFSDYFTLPDLFGSAVWRVRSCGRGGREVATVINASGDLREVAMSERAEVLTKDYEGEQDRLGTVGKRYA